MPRLFNEIMITLYMPLVLSADLLVVLFWLEILTVKKIQTIVYLKKLRLPFFIYVGYLITAELATSVARVFYSGTFTTVFTLLNIIIALVVMVSVIIIVIKKINNHIESGHALNARLQRMSRYMIAIVVFALLMVLALLAMASRQFTRPWGTMIPVGLASAFFACKGINQINMFQPLGRQFTSSTTMGSTNSSL